MDIKLIQERVREVGLGADPKYHFLFGPMGLAISLQEAMELEAIAQAAWQFISTVDAWYQHEKQRRGGSIWASLLEKDLPGDYSATSWSGMPQTFMIDTILTAEGFRVVEIDVTNRNAMGYPLLMRYLYGLDPIWSGLDEEWRSGGWGGVVQIMASHHRFYEPYFRFFLGRLGGQLVKEEELPVWLEDRAFAAFLDLPVLFRSKEVLPKLLQVAERSIFGIPPKHYLSSKANLALLWESPEFNGFAIKEFVPETRLVSRDRPLPRGDFFLKSLQASGAHGVAFNSSKIKELHQGNRPQAIWQAALPLATRRLAYSDGGDLQEDDFHVRLSIFVNQQGQVVDADATASKSIVVHGSPQSVMTVPVLN